MKHSTTKRKNPLYCCTGWQTSIKSLKWLTHRGKRSIKVLEIVAIFCLKKAVEFIIRLGKSGLLARFWFQRRKKIFWVNRASIYYRSRNSFFSAWIIISIKRFSSESKPLLLLSISFSEETPSVSQLNLNVWWSTEASCSSSEEN